MMNGINHSESNKGATSPSAKNVHPYLTFKSHFSGPTHDTELVVMEAVRKAHPDAHITPIPEQFVDIFGWTAAGNAKLTPVQDNTNSFLRRRRYRGENETADGVDSLYDHDIFAHYQLVYKDHTFDTYVAEWAWSFMGKRFRQFYIVASQTQASFVDQMLLLIARWTNRLHNEVYVFDDGDWNKDPSLWQTIKASRWEDVILDPAIKEPLLRDVLGFFSSKAVYTKYNVPWKRGLILYGPPGNGKTMALRALMNALPEQDDISCMVVKSFRSCSDPEASIQAVFEHARGLAPCVLVFEDLDSMITEKLRSYFLNQIDGIESNDGILIIASTNYVERLDASMSKRPSRFDKKYAFKLPDKAARIRYCEHWATKLRENDDIALTPGIVELVASLTEGFSFAYLKELLVQALFALLRGEQAGHVDSGEEGDIRKNLAKSMPGLEVSAALLSAPFARAVCRQAISLREDMDVTGR